MKMSGSFKKIFFKQPILCSYCNDYIWGWKLYGYNNEETKLCFHSVCKEFHKPWSTIPDTSSYPAVYSHPVDPKSWSVEDVIDWMPVVNLDRYSLVFENHLIDGNKLIEMNEQFIFKNLKIKDNFHINSILTAIECLVTVSNNQEVNLKAGGPSNHDLSIYSFTTPQQCHLCGQALLGIMRQGLQCRVCGFCCHRKCSSFHLPPCSPGPSIPRRNSFTADSLFGKDLISFYSVPEVVCICSQELERRAKSLDKKLIDFYRMTPSTEKVKELKDFLDANQGNLRGLDLNSYEPETIGGIMKKFLRDLPNPVIPEASYILFINLNLQPTEVNNLFSLMPSVHRSTLEHLSNHFTSDKIPDRNYIGKFAHIFHNIFLRPPWQHIKRIVHDRENQSKIVENILKKNYIHMNSWYFDDISRDGVDELMVSMPDGSFLVRNASQPDNSEPYTLTLRKGGMNKLIKICYKDGSYFLDYSKSFDSVKDLVENYKLESLSSFNDSLDICLLHPISKDSIFSSPQPSEKTPMNLNELRNKFKKDCKKIKDLTNSVESKHLEEEGLIENIKQLQITRQGYLKIHSIYKDHIDMAESELENNMDNSLKRIYETSLKKMEQKIELLKKETRNLENEIKTLDLDLQELSNKIEEEKNKLSELISNKEMLKKTLILLNEPETNLERMQEGKDIEQISHYEERTWLVDMNREEASTILSGKEKGTFLIRPREDDDHPNSHALSIVNPKNEVCHCIIYHKFSGYGFAEPYFIHQTLLELVLHYKYTSLVEHNDSLDVTLEHPIYQIYAGAT